MLHLRHYNSSPPLLLTHSSIYKLERLIFPSGFRAFEVHQLLELKMKRRNGSFGAVEKHSEFEVDPDKAREALRKLDEQLLSLSKKQVNPPKIRDFDGAFVHHDGLVEARLKQSIQARFCIMDGQKIQPGTANFQILLVNVAKKCVIVRCTKLP